MKNVLNKFAVFLCLIILLGSCRARFYTANRNPVPLFKKQGDVYFDASTNLINKVDFTAGYALTDNIGGYIGYGGSAQSQASDSAQQNDRKYRGNMLNLGLGYFISSKQSEAFRFEIYADYAGGSFKNNATEDGDKHFFNGRFRRVGLMPVIGFSDPSGHFSFVYSLRASNLSFMNERFDSQNYWQKDLDRYHRKSSYTMLEHAITTRFGGEHVKLQLQGAVYRNLNVNTDDYAIAPVNFSLIFGIVFELGKSGS